MIWGSVFVDGWEGAERTLRESWGGRGSCSGVVGELLGRLSPRSSALAQEPYRWLQNEMRIIKLAYNRIEIHGADPLV